MKIGITGNFDKKNYEEFFRLLDDLEWADLTPDKISSIRFAPIVNRPEGDISPVDYTAGCMSSNEPWLIEAEAFLRGEILRRGFNTPKARPMFCAVAAGALDRERCARVTRSAPRPVCLCRA